MNDKYKGHTPGPWKLDKETAFLWASNQEGHNRLAIHVSGCCRCGCNTQDMDAESLANAKLISDAPMLASENEELKEEITRCKDNTQKDMIAMSKLAEQNKKMLAMLKRWRRMTLSDIAQDFYIDDETDNLIAEVEGES